MASILVVDDDPDSRALTEGQLEAGGHDVVVATDAGAALAMVRGRPPDVIVCDLLRADLGWRVLAEVKADADTAVSEIPVIVMSGGGSDNDRIRAAIDGAIDHLVKPVLAVQLDEAVRGALDGDPDAVQRHRARAAALEQMARQETGHPPVGAERVHLTRLERTREVEEIRTERGAPEVDPATLTDKQSQLLTALRREASVSDAAASLGVSRSNVYASLRRISRKLDVGSVQALLHLLRTDQLGL